MNEKQKKTYLFQIYSLVILKNTLKKILIYSISHKRKEIYRSDMFSLKKLCVFFNFLPPKIKPFYPRNTF